MVCFLRFYTKICLFLSFIIHFQDKLTTFYFTMDTINFLIVAGLLHCSLFFFNVIFKSCLHYPYFLFLENTGLEIKTLSLKWYTTAFNRKILKWATDRSRFWTLWFDIGVVVSIILLPVATMIVLKMTFDNLFLQSESEGSNRQWNLEPMIPGINIPFSDIQYYIITLGLCSIFHEFGHAVASSLENVQLCGVGLMLAFIVPLSYVSIDSDQLKQLRLKNKLRILCAGVWHNLVLAVVAAVIFYISGWIWAPLFLSNSGVYIKSIEPNSPLLGPKGLLNNDIIYKINDCPVKNNNDWYHCILQSVKQPTPGYCVVKSIIEEYDESIPATIENGVINCCRLNEDLNGKLCFEHVEDSAVGPLQLQLHSCLSARILIERSIRYCQYSFQCAELNAHCMIPQLNNSTKIVQLSRREGSDVLFLGHPHEIYQSVKISNWIPRHQFFNPNIPESLEILCKYMTVLSAGLAVINIIPCFFFDGQYIVMELSQNLLRPFISNKSMRDTIPLTLVSVGTILLTINILLTFIRM